MACTAISKNRITVLIVGLLLDLIPFERRILQTESFICCGCGRCWIRETIVLEGRNLRGNFVFFEVYCDTVQGNPSLKKRGKINLSYRQRGVERT
jgi:hypothetical protein